MKPARILLAALVLGLGAWFLFAVFGPSSAPPAPAVAFESSTQCRQCHPRVWEEWQASQHAIAWTDPSVRELSNDFANQDCIDCHAPRPVFVTGLGNRVLPRTARRREGVDCIACHQLPAAADGTPGGVAGTRTNPRAPCRPVERLELLQPELCAGCHNQHKTVDQWRASSWPARGEDCLACHMPPREGAPAGGRDHRFLGGDDLGMLRRAVELTGVRDGAGWRIALANVGAGHAFPTDERSRRADLFWRPAGTAPWRLLYRIRDPYRTETGIPRTLIDADQTLTVGLPEAGAVEVALFYKRTPYYEDPDAPDPEREARLVVAIELTP